MQEEVNQKTVALSIRAAKLSGKVLASAFQKGNRGAVIYFVASAQNAGPISFTVRSAVLPRSCGQVRRDPVQDDRWQ